MLPACTPISAPPVAPERAQMLSPQGWGVRLPLAICEAGERAAVHSAEYFAAQLTNENTRAVYGRAVAEFCGWCHEQGLPLPALTCLAVAAYFHELRERLSPSSANVHLTAVRQWLEWLTRSGVLPFNPAAPVRGLRLSRLEGKTPVLEREQARRLFAALERSDELVALRDRAILAVMLYDFVRVGAVVRMRVRPPSWASSSDGVARSACPSRSVTTRSERRASRCIKRTAATSRPPRAWRATPTPARLRIPLHSSIQSART